MQGNDSNTFLFAGGIRIIRSVYMCIYMQSWFSRKDIYCSHTVNQVKEEQPKVSLCAFININVEILCKINKNKNYTHPINSLCIKTLEIDDVE